MQESETTATADAPVATPHLVAAVRRLADARRATVTAVGLVKGRRESWEMDHKGILEAERQAKATEDQTEAELRALVVAHYRTTGDKEPAPGVGIRITVEVEYDRDVAFVFAKAQNIALALDEKALKAIAKASPSTVPFVRLIETPQATVAKDLDLALAAGGAL